jgi:hypothetical protein
MIKTQKNELHNKATRTMRDITELLILCISLRELKIFCAFQNIQESMTAKIGFKDQQSVCERKEIE